MIDFSPHQQVVSTMTRFQNTDAVLLHSTSTTATTTTNLQVKLKVTLLARPPPFPLGPPIMLLLTRNIKLRPILLSNTLHKFCAIFSTI